MYALIKDNTFVKTIQDNESFNIGEQIYSSTFIRNSTVESLNQLGIYEIIDSTRPDDRFYWVTGPTYVLNNTTKFVETTYTTTDKQLNDIDESTGLKTQYKNIIKETANALLKNTDWMIIRKIERNIDVPSTVSTYRQNVLTECDRLVNLLDNVSTVTDLIDIVQNQNWPKIN